MKTTDEYQASLSNAIAFRHEYPEEKSITAARIYGVNDNTIWSTLHRERKRQQDGSAVKHRGYNKILSKVQVKAIYKYVKDLYRSRYGLTKAMVYAIVNCLKAN